MPPIRTPLKKLRDNDANERNSRRRGRKPKTLEQRVPNLQIKPIQRVQCSYSRLKKIQVLMWLKYHRLPNEAPNTAIKMRPPTLEEASAFFQISTSTIGHWRQTAEKILQQAGNSRRDTPVVFLCMWPEMEKKLFDAFIKRREIGRRVGDGWFRRNAIELWKQTYPDSDLQQNLFVFSKGWFLGFLSRHRIVLRCITNTAQSLLTDYKEQILVWLRFNRRNRILTPLFTSQPSPSSLHLLCNDDEGGIPQHRICNVDETPLPWEYLIGHTYDLQGVKTVWSKSADSGSEKRQCTLFLCIFADGVCRVPPILIFTAPTGDKIRKKESHLWDKRVHVEFSPTGWMNEALFSKFIKKFLIPIFGNHRALFIFDRYKAHLTPPVIQLCRDHKITPSLIPAGTAPLTQPLDIAINKPFKSLIKEFTEEIRERKEDEEDIEKWSVSQHRVVTTEAVGRAWEEWHRSEARRKIVIQTFRDTGISLPVDGSCDHELKIKGFAPGELVIGNWARSEEEAGYGITENENSEQPRSRGLQFQLQDELSLGLEIQRHTGKDLGEDSGEDSEIDLSGAQN